MLTEKRALLRQHEETTPNLTEPDIFRADPNLSVRVD